ncbi:MAG: FISUMP domain-containing protein [Bacteroidota bacterium]|nr:FISUMP domain-containing protein [Bacteroidota bacterium]
MKLKQLSTISLITLLVLSPVLFQSCDDKHNTVPSALFTISPSYGSVDSTFVFDASDVRDIEDPTEELEVRWDWESDSIFDTEFTTNKIAEHKFATGGTYYITLEVRDTEGLTVRKTDFLRIAWPNRAPNANFIVNPETGYLQDIFIFDASSCSDAEDDNNSLQVRWDFEGDGTWDTEFSSGKIAEYQYTISGDYDIQLEVVDSKGLTDVASYMLVVGGTNQEPESPLNISPLNDDNAVTSRCLLEWSCTDPDGDELLFDVYFGSSDNPPKIASDITAFSYLCLPLEFTSDYYWKIVAKDPYDHIVSSETWIFSTLTPINEMSVMTDPRDGKKYKTVNINDKLWLAQNLNVGTMINASSGGDVGDGYQRDNGKTEKYCYANKKENCDIYGGLYQWDEAMGFSENINAEGICPPGWHIPNVDEWRELMLYYKEDLGVAAGDNLVWGSNSGFEILYSGYLIFAERKFYDSGQAGYMWSSNINPGTGLNHLSMIRSVFNDKPDFQEDTSQRRNGLPVRCVQNY